MAWRDVVFQYDGSFDGFLCCVFESYTHKEFPIAFCGDEECWSLYEVRYVVTVREHAGRILRSISMRSAAAAEVLRRAFLTCLEDKEIRLYAFIKKIYEDGADFLRNTSDPVYYPIAKALRHMAGELEKLRGFIRFSDYQGVLGAEIEPKNRVLPPLRRHFCGRYANESFFIYDRVHKEILFYSGGHSRIVPLDNLQLSVPGEEEIGFRQLWKRFYDTIAIQARFNPRCQNTFMPKRYRGTMTEFLPLRYEEEARANRPDTGAALPDSCAQDGKPAPAIHTGCGPSVLASGT